MLFSDSVFVGVDSTSSHKAFVYAALDRDMNLLTLADGELEEVVSFLGMQKSVSVAVNAPARVNRGLVRKKMKNDMLTPHQIRGADMRVAEYELRELGIAISGTPDKIGTCPAWMQLGFGLYRKLEKMGYKHYLDTDSENRIMETHPHACFSVLGGSGLHAKPSMEGRLQRQLILYERGVRIKDPMDFFEEITRHKILKGIWPVELLYLPEQLDALVAAYTAWLAINKPDHTSTIGDQLEGLIVLPEKELKEKY